MNDSPQRMMALAQQEMAKQGKSFADFVPMVPPGAQAKALEREEIERREAAALAEIETQKALVRDHQQRVAATKTALVGSRLGLASLFPSNKFGFKVVKAPGQPTRILHQDATTQFNQAAMDAARNAQGNK